MLLKIVTWLGCLSFLGSTGIVWADLRPVSESQTEAQALVTAAKRDNVAAIPEVEIYGPPIPATWQQSSAQVAADNLPNREVPIPIEPAAPATPPTAKIIRPQHADLLVAENYTVSVNGAETVTPTAVTIPVPAPRQATIPGQSSEMVSSLRSRVQPRYARPKSPIVQSVPTTSINLQSNAGQSSTPYRPVPRVPTLAANNLKSTPGQIQSRSTNTRIPTPTTDTLQRPLSGFKPVIVAPMRPSAVQTVNAAPQKIQNQTLSNALLGKSINSVEIPVPQPRTQIIKVQPVAQLPQVKTTKSVPTIPPIPTVRAASRSESKPVAYINNGEHDSTPEIIYPLSSPAPVTSRFGWRTHPITGSRRFHSGIDIGAPMGAPVVAAGSGTIVSAAWIGGYGKAIIIQHNGVHQTLYGHLSEIFVQPGQRIEQGTVIGRVGSTGNSTGPHLHFESRMSTADGWVAVDPGDDVKYALENLRRAMPFAQRDLPPRIN